MEGEAEIFGVCDSSLQVQELTEMFPQLIGCVLAKEQRGFETINCLPRPRKIFIKHRGEFLKILVSSFSKQKQIICKEEVSKDGAASSNSQSFQSAFLLS